MLGLLGRNYWTFDRPVVSEIIDSEFEVGSSGVVSNAQARLFAYTMKVFRKVNGSPWLDVYLTAWVHRSGQIMKLDVTGMGVDSLGDPGVEVPTEPLSSVVRRVGLEEARLKVKNWLAASSYEIDEPIDVVAYTLSSDRRFVVPKYFAGVELRSKVTSTSGVSELLAGSRLLVLDLENREDSIHVVQ